MNEKRDSNVRSVNRALSILKEFTPEQSELSLCRISNSLHLPKSTVLRLVRTMEKEGFIEQDNERGTYRLGMEALRIGAVVQTSKRIAVVATTFMEELSKDTGETSNLYIRVGYDRMCIMQIEGENYVLRYSYVGARKPLYCGAAGLVLLAYSEKEFINKYLSTTQLVKITNNTITDKSVLLNELTSIRDKGYGVSLGQWDKLSASVAAPVFDYSKKIIAAITLSGPCSYYSRSIIQDLGPIVMKAAVNISKKMGLYQYS